MTRDRIIHVIKRPVRAVSALAVAAALLTALSAVPAQAQYVVRSYQRTSYVRHYPTTYYAPVRRAYIPVRRSYVPVRRTFVTRSYVPVRRTLVRRSYAPSYYGGYYSPYERRRSSRTRDVLTVVAGTAGGALVGGLVGGRKGAAIGALIGGAGSGTAVYVKNRNRDRYYRYYR